MEDLKKRLSFPNTSVQVQAAWKLYGEVVKKKPKQGQICSADPESIEIKLLWEKCGNEESSVANAVCCALVQLVADGIAEFTYVLNGFLNLVPSVKNLSGIVAGIGKLLILQAVAIENQGQDYVCPFRIRTPPHPLITVLTNRPEAWPFLEHQVYALCCHGNKSVRHHAMKILAPFLKFVLLEPQQSPRYQSMRNGLQRVLLLSASQSQDKTVARNIISFIATILPCFQLHDADGITAACHLVIDTLHICHGMSAGQMDVQLSGLMETGLMLCHACTSHGLKTSQLTDIMMTVIQDHQKLMRNDKIVMMLSCLLLTSDDLSPLLYMCEKIVEGNHGDLCPVTLRCLILPALQVLATPHTPLQPMKKLHAMAGRIIRLIENASHLESEGEKKPAETQQERPKSGLTPFSQEVDQYAILSSSLSPEMSVVWMTNLMSSVTSSAPICVPNLVAALLISSRSREESSLAVKLVVNISKKDNNQAPLFVPVLLYQLRREQRPEIRLEILHALPALAVAKVCVPVILKTIQSFGMIAKMKPISIQMMSSLWQVQDRCFPHLLNMITEGEKKCSGSYDLLLAKAKCLRDVCKLKPEQHGTDVLGPLNEVLDAATGDEDAPIAALVLEGLYYLCEAEVINIQSAWSVLADKLSHDTRPVVVKKMCELFSLVPNLEVKTPEFEKFMEESVSYLWLFTNSSDSVVCGAAYQSLAKYRADQFKVSSLPSQVTEDFVQQAVILAKQEDPEADSVNVDDVITAVPAVCYVRLLKSLSTESLTGYEDFLSSMVAKEVESLPRGIYHSSLQRHGAAVQQNKTISSIPTFLLTQYEKTKQPGLRPGLAAGLLFAYNPVLQVGRDGRPRKHYMITHGKNFQQMFNTLLHEVPIQPSEWHRNMTMSQAWLAFVDRLFSSMLEWRVAEISLQLKRDHIDEDEAKEKKELAWLWVRDTLTDTIKSTSRGNPTMQSNAVYALAGLAVTVNRYLMGLQEEERKTADDSTEYMSPSHWLMVVLDTVMSLMDVNFTPKGSLLGMCQQRSVEDRLPASVLVQASAAISLSQLVPVIITLDMERVYSIVSFLSDRLPASPHALESPVLLFHTGLGLGMFLARLTEEHFSDISGTKGMLQIWKALDKLEECCFSEETESKAGVLLGLQMAVCALCDDGKTESRAHVSSVYDRLLHLCEDSSKSEFQVLCVCTASVAGSAFCSNILNVAQVNAAVDMLMTSHQSNPQVSGVCLALGMLCYNLTRGGHPGISDIRVKLFGDWLKQIKDQDTPPVQKVAVLNGILALVGSERTLIPLQNKGNSSLGGEDVNMDQVIKMSMEILTDGSDLGIQSNSAWMLGHLYLSACTIADTRSSVPSSYSYLPESSFLRAVIDFLAGASKLGPESLPRDQVRVALSCLYRDVEGTLPPINWAGILTPLVRLGFGKEVESLSLNIAVKQSRSAPTASIFLSSWVIPPLVNTLNESSLISLYELLPLMITSLAPAVIKGFLEHGAKTSLSGGRNNILVPLLLGLDKALKVRDPPEAMTAVLHKVTESCYLQMSSSAQVEEMCAIAECLGNLPDDLFDKLIEEDFVKQDRHFLGCVIRCHLVAKGRQPLALLNGCIDTCFNNTKCDFSKVLWYLQHCIYRIWHQRAEVTGVLQRIQWLVELLGHIRNIATGVIVLSQDSRDLTEVMDFAFDVVSSAVCLWTSNTSAAVLGLNAQLLSQPDTRLLPNKNYTKIFARRSESRGNYLPSFARGLEKEPWDQVLPKVMDWLMTLMVLPSAVIRGSTREVMQASLLVLRQSNVFRQPSLWSAVCDSL